MLSEQTGTEPNTYNTHHSTTPIKSWVYPGREEKHKDKQHNSRLFLVSLEAMVSTFV